MPAQGDGGAWEPVLLPLVWGPVDRRFGPPGPLAWACPIAIPPCGSAARATGGAIATPSSPVSTAAWIVTIGVGGTRTDQLGRATAPDRCFSSPATGTAGAAGPAASAAASSAPAAAATSTATASPATTGAIGATATAAAAPGATLAAAAAEVEGWGREDRGFKPGHLLARQRIADHPLNRPQQFMLFGGH